MGFHPPWNQTQNCSDNRSLLQTLSPPNPDSGNSCLTTRKSTRRSEKSLSALKSTNLTQAASRTMASGSDTTPEVLVRTCTWGTEMFLSHSPSPRCIEKWPLDIELDQVPSRFSELNRSNLTSADDHKTNRCTIQTSNSHSHDESCPRLPNTPDDSPPNDQTPSTKYKSKIMPKNILYFSVIHVHNKILRFSKF